MYRKEFPRYLKLGEAVKYLNVGSYTAVHNFIDQGLPVTVINGIKRIDRLDADKFMEAHKTEEVK
ncbi:prophage Lp3 protein 4 [Pediococcus damnosus]|uniref:hypothetical protein n=1 Tax=Pediococcus damnosus TaxID=51663 RepID=UPI00078B52C6|nr:hypothetical protein [Pediococcus damnosus]AMV60133.1 prophage Lp3 protein 4 [Pediococcus damnosus]AMV64377.1 prophage Lp3 protein 4 [Pediococcus damnosus]